MNRFYKEMQLAELKVTRDNINQQIERLERELAADGIASWMEKVQGNQNA